MRESRTYRSVRGAGSNLRPYRDPADGVSDSNDSIIQPSTDYNFSGAVFRVWDAIAQN
jgi:hypothetical protein